jgi:BRCT domain type II-containing protein
VVAGEEAGTKLDRARDLGLSILTEDAFTILLTHQDRHEDEKIGLGTED